MRQPDLITRVLEKAPVGSSHRANADPQVWWSPCPSRECPEAEELDLVLDDCLDHCLLLENSNAKPKKKTLLQEIHQGIAVRPPTLLPEVRLGKVRPGEASLVGRQCARGPVRRVAYPPVRGRSLGA